MFSGSDGIAVRGIHYDDAIHCGCGNVDVVHSNTRATDNFEIRSRLKDIGGYFSFAANDQTFTVLKCRDEFILREPRQFFDNQPSITQGLKAIVAYVICYEYFHSFWSAAACRRFVTSYLSCRSCNLKGSDGGL